MRISIAYISILLQACTVVQALITTTAPFYNYFAIGSNMLPSTMESLRNIRDYSASAAVLRDYRLAFDIPGVPCIEPSSASARYCPGQVMHGVLYTLSADDFAKVGNTEGVPWVYRWERVNVVPYKGDGKSAGVRALNEGVSPAIEAYVLVPTIPSPVEHIPTSKSYLRILQRGASFWQLDRDYQISIGKYITADTMLISDGLAEKWLHFAELVNPASKRS